MLSENKKIDKMLHQEALHTSFIFMEVVSEYLCEHPAVQQSKDRSELANKAKDNLYRLYQLIGNEVI